MSQPESNPIGRFCGRAYDLRVKASGDRQILIVTHSKALVQAIDEQCEAKLVDLVSFEGQTEDREKAGCKPPH
jgi:hypothetical protein